MTKKYKPSIIVAGGVSFYGLSDLILLKGTIKEFAYPQALEYYIEKFDDFKEHNKKINYSNRMEHFVILQEKSKY